MRGDGITITVDKAQLLDTLKENRDKHGAAYEKAKAGYIKTTMKQLEDYVRRLADGELLEHRFINSPPDDHTGDYDDVIAMMEWSTDDTIELDQYQFSQYVKDDWGWKEQWLTSTAGYTNAAGG
jgi:hypothetical protein